STSIRRKPSINPSPTTTLRPQIQFSKTTRRPTTTRPITTPGPKLRPVYRKKDIDEESLAIPLKHEVVRQTATAKPVPVFRHGTVGQGNIVPSPPVPTPSLFQPIIVTATLRNPSALS
ncbi:unnamed protein product, partial [Strongylus vulgaris]